MTVKMEGLNKVRRRIGKIMKQAPEAVGAGLYAGGLQVIGDAMEHYTPVDTGYLKNAHYVAPPKSRGKRVWCKLGNGAAYAVYVHEGTDEMAARKFLKKAMYHDTNKLLKVIAQVAEDHLARGTGIAIQKSDVPKSESGGRARGKAKATEGGGDD